MPEPGGYVEILSEQLLLGGEAANTANALALWGAEVSLIGNGFGKDPLLQRELAQRGLDPFEGHLLPYTMTPVCDVYVDDRGMRTMIGQGFSSMKESVDPEKIPFRAGEWLTAEPNMGDVARRSLVLAYEAGMKVYAMDFVEDDDPVREGSVWQSSTDWAGVRGDTEANLRFVRTLVERRRCLVILSDGANGFVAGSRETEVRAYPPFPPPSVADATGAGDIFRAGMLFGLDQDWPIGHCLRFAAAAGCLACRSLGATADVPARMEIDELIASNPGISAAYL